MSEGYDVPLSYRGDHGIGKPASGLAKVKKKKKVSIKNGRHSRKTDNERRKIKTNKNEAVLNVLPYRAEQNRAE